MYLGWLEEGWMLFLDKESIFGDVVVVYQISLTIEQKSMIIAK